MRLRGRRSILTECRPLLPLRNQHLVHPVAPLPLAATVLIVALPWRTPAVRPVATLSVLAQSSATIAALPSGPLQPPQRPKPILSPGSWPLWRFSHCLPWRLAAASTHDPPVRSTAQRTRCHKPASTIAGWLPMVSPPVCAGPTSPACRRRSALIVYITV